MVVITEISIAAEQFELGRLFTDLPTIRVEGERLVPNDSGVMPLLWISGADADAVEETLRAADLSADQELLAQTDERALFEVRWDPSRSPFIAELSEHTCTVLGAAGTAEQWAFRILFHDREALRSFRGSCEANGVGFDLHQLNEFCPDDRGGGTRLTGKQREVLLMAHERGFWEVPREVTTAQLGAELGVSAQAVSERLRRATRRLVAGYVNEQTLRGSDRR